MIEIKKREKGGSGDESSGRRKGTEGRSSNWMIEH